MKNEFELPLVVDHGTLMELTRANGFTCEEDGASKLVIHHVSDPICNTN